jgi:hypothetical protein
VQLPHLRRVLSVLHVHATVHGAHLHSPSSGAPTAEGAGMCGFSARKHRVVSIDRSHAAAPAWSGVPVSTGHESERRFSSCPLPPQSDGSGPLSARRRESREETFLYLSFVRYKHDNVKHANDELSSSASRIEVHTRRNASRGSLRAALDCLAQCSWLRRRQAVS